MTKEDEAPAFAEASAWQANEELMLVIVIGLRIAVSMLDNYWVY